MAPTRARLRRLTSGFTLEAVAAASGISATRLARLERGDPTAGVSELELERLGSAYGASPATLRAEFDEAAAVAEAAARRLARRAADGGLDS